MSNFSPEGDQSSLIRIKIIGLGGAGSNMVNRLKLDDFDTISTIAVNTDAQALADLQCDETMLLGASITHGLGTGGELEIGKTIAANGKNSSHKRFITALNRSTMAAKKNAHVALSKGTKAIANSPTISIVSSSTAIA